jgi:hypothetical protein
MARRRVDLRRSQEQARGQVTARVAHLSMPSAPDEKERQHDTSAETTEEQPTRGRQSRRYDHHHRQHSETADASD